jgi:Domain of unknown function (DU1801)
MALTDTHIILPMLQRFPQHVQDAILYLRNLTWERYPESNELIYEKANAIAIGWSFTDKAGDIFVSFAAYTKHVNLGFHNGHLLQDPEGLLEGGSKLYRYFKVGALHAFPLAYATQLMDASWMNAQAALKPKAKLIQGQTMIKQRLDAKQG